MFFWPFKKNKTTLINVVLDEELISQNKKEGSCYLTVAFPTIMPEEEQQDIKKRLEDIVDDIRRYL